MWQQYISIIQAKLVFFALPIIAVTSEGVSGLITDRWGPLINIGAIGCVLAWFLLKTEPRLRRIEEAIDRGNRATLLAVISMQGVPEPVKAQAQSLIQDIQLADERRKGQNAS